MPQLGQPACAIDGHGTLGGFVRSFQEPCNEAAPGDAVDTAPLAVHPGQGGEQRKATPRHIATPDIVEHIAATDRLASAVNVYAFPRASQDGFTATDGGASRFRRARVCLAAQRTGKEVAPTFHLTGFAGFGKIAVL